MSKKDFASEIHHRVVKKFPRRKVKVTGIDNVWSMDLADMNSLMKYNDQYRYILCVIYVFSKFAWSIPLKNKTAASILNAVKSIVESSGRTPEKIWVDRGSEFYNKDFEKWIKSKNIVMYSTYGESKSVIVERFIRTLKDMMTREFTETNSRNWVKLLPKVLDEYNNRVHKTTGMSPIDASDPDNEVVVYLHMYPKEEERKSQKSKFSVGDDVRISRVKNIFEKGMEPNFSHEVFKIDKVLDTDPITYKIKDYYNEVIAGSFYSNELLKTKLPDYYEVEKVISERKVGKKKEYLVKFVGWPKKFNMYLSEDQMYDIPTK